MTSRTRATAGYLAADLAHSQRYLIPLALYAAVLAILSAGDPGPAPGPWPATTLALYPAAAWFALLVANTENPVQRTITTASAGGAGRVAVAPVLVALAVDVVLGALSVAVPALRSATPYPAAALLAGGLAHLAAATTGTAVGMLCARPLVMRIGWSFCIAVSVVVITAVQPWLPPVGSAVRTLTAHSGAPPGGTARRPPRRRRHRDQLGRRPPGLTYSHMEIC
ncbi:hypothetical protein [Pseudonocardia sp. GCM10023141]|uniref:hypothetical protein n=1 Tax=Pseudonocardia sp. GCM10023141 TaxID=3252653 RepID=UPI00360CC1C6